MITARENYLRALEFRYPEWVPCSLGCSPDAWHKYRDELEDLHLRHPLLFPDFEKGAVDFDDFAVAYKEGEYYRDNWGCLWYNIHGGLEGQVVEHPLADWKALDAYRPPDVSTRSERGERNWDQVRREIEAQRARGLLTAGSGERLFDRLYFLRGFEALMVDFATDDPHLPRLIDLLLEYELELVGKWLEIGVDMISFHTDIGTQKGLMISPEKFRRYLKPMFRELFMTCRKAGAHVGLSSDGHLLSIVDDLVECGVSMHDPQLRANTLEGIERCYKGKICIKLDLDRQMFPFCTPRDIWNQVEEALEKLYLPQGGLMLMGSVSAGDVPLENIEALASAMEDLCLKGRAGA